MDRGSNRGGSQWRPNPPASDPQSPVPLQQSDLHNSRSTTYMMAGDKSSELHDYAYTERTTSQHRGHSMPGRSVNRGRFSGGGRYQYRPISTEKDVCYDQHRGHSGRGRSVDRDRLPMQGRYLNRRISNEKEANYSISGHSDDSVPTGGARVDNEQDLHDSAPTDAMVRNESLEPHNKAGITHNRQISPDTEVGESVSGHSDTVPTGGAPVDFGQNLHDSTSMEMMVGNESLEPHNKAGTTPDYCAPSLFLFSPNHPDRFSEEAISHIGQDLHISTSIDMMAGDKSSEPHDYAYTKRTTSQHYGHSVRGRSVHKDTFSKGGRCQNRAISTEKDVCYTQHCGHSGRGRSVHRERFPMQGRYQNWHISNEKEANYFVSGHSDDSVPTGGAPFDNGQDLHDLTPTDVMVCNENLEPHNKAGTTPDYCGPSVFRFSADHPDRSEEAISHNGQISPDTEVGDSVSGHSDTVPTGGASVDFGQNLHDSTSMEMMVGNESSGQSDNIPPTGMPFDICPIKRGGPPKLKASLHRMNKEKRNELARSSEQRLLRRGMVLLKNYLSSSEQIKITKTCRDLGIGDGGFYQPDFNGGAKLHLKMMCLGKNWDPRTRLYEESRSIDRAAIPAIPEDFKMLVEKAIRVSHALIKRELKENNSERILPWMKPDICIVNFYTETGKLGLHQDRDESRESLSKGLPVVSFSIGDSAEFLYGDSRDVEEAEKVVLESGDVLIFGGEARHVFHGVPSINQGTAPKFLNEATNLRPGRLNLTFRQY